MIRLSVTFTDVAGVPTDTTVVLTLKKPDGTESVVGTTNDSAGKYHADVTPDQTGMYYYYFGGTGAIVAAAQGQFNVYGGSV